MNTSINQSFFTKMEHLGVENVCDLLLYLPTKYIDYRQPIKGGISELKKSGTSQYIQLMVVSKPIFEYKPKRPAMVKVKLSDGDIIASASIFGATSDWKEIKQNDLIHVVAKYDEFNGFPQLKNIEVIPDHQQGRIVPVYKGKPKVVSPKTIENKIAIALRESINDAVNYLCEKVGTTEEKILRQATPELTKLVQLFYALHRPKSREEVKLGMDSARMINAYKSLIMAASSRRPKSIPASVIKYTVEDIKKQLKNVPFTLTKDQARTVWEISKDLSSDIPMDRLISGDVGCGKTLAYSIPAVCAYHAGADVLIYTPNLLLCYQVADEIKKIFPDTDVQLCVAGNKPKGVPSKNSIIVGTSAILFWLKDLKAKHDYTYEADLLVIDEQQKIGSEQKSLLVSEKTNVIEATATAVPRTYANMIYGTKKVSYIEECPVEKSIHTTVCGTELKSSIFEHFGKIIKEGYQVAVLYPIRKAEYGIYEMFVPTKMYNNAVSHEGIMSVLTNKNEVIGFYQNSPKENDDSIIDTDGWVYQYRIKHSQAKRIMKSIEELVNPKDEDGQLVNKYVSNEIIYLGDTESEEEIDACKRSVESAALHWEQFYPSRVVSIHGGMSVNEKLEAINKAKNNECDAIITSSVIEIGLTMPSLRGLLVLEADRYGASTLHQFRGRLARQGGEGYFYLYVNKPIGEVNDETIARLNILKNFDRGSQIAQMDMRQRGFGEINESGRKQHGFLKGVFIGLKDTPQDIDLLLTKSPMI